jgi:hypothetical protein
LPRSVRAHSGRVIGWRCAHPITCRVLNNPAAVFVVDRQVYRYPSHALCSVLCWEPPRLAVRGGSHCTSDTCAKAPPTKEMRGLSDAADGEKRVGHPATTQIHARGPMLPAPKTSQT